jgi:hypothetical protein
MKTRMLSIAAAALVASMAGNAPAFANDNLPDYWFLGDFWTAKPIKVKGGTIKSGDFETICDKDPKKCGSDVDLPDRGSKPKPKPNPKPQ